MPQLLKVIKHSTAHLWLTCACCCPCALLLLLLLLLLQDALYVDVSNKRVRAYSDRGGAGGLCMLVVMHW
jgi:hypothetical protein